MRIEIKREYNKNSISGRLSVDGLFICYTLERKDKAIPAAKYDVSLRESPKFGLTPYIKNVPGREYILIHRGNYINYRMADGTVKNDSQGCILVGDSILHEATFISSSSAAFTRLMDILVPHKGQITLEIY